MLYRCLLALLCALSVGSSHGQIKVELEFEQETYLPKEPLYAVVRVYNNSGRTLLLGQDREWLSFTVESVDGSVVRQVKPAEVQGEFNLPSSARAKKLVNLAEAFDLTKFGRYEVRAIVRIPNWPDSYTTKAVPFGIATGVKLWETAFGMPDEIKAGLPEIRKFQLLSANHLKRLSLYVRVTSEAENQTFNLFPLGPLHGFSRPEPQVDRWSNLHVLYQDGARSFKYHMITPDGLLLERQAWEVIDGSRPALKLDATGHIAVAGGIRRVSPADLPPPDLLTDSARASEEAIPADKPLDATPTAK